MTSEILILIGAILMIGGTIRLYQLGVFGKHGPRCPICRKLKTIHRGDSFKCQRCDTIFFPDQNSERSE